MKIAVFMLDAAVICPFLVANSFVVYDRSEQGWEIQRRKSFVPVELSSPQQLRSSMRSLISQLSDCSIVAGGAISGISYLEFNRAGLHIFEIETINKAVLNSMLEDVVAAECARSIREAIISKARPVPTETDGIYYLDLVLLQKECPEISSKNAMQEFLLGTPFLELHLVCNHIPPWIENDASLSLQVNSQSQDNTISAVIRKVC